MLFVHAVCLDSETSKTRHFLIRLFCYYIIISNAHPTKMQFHQLMRSICNSTTENQPSCCSVLYYSCLSSRHVDTVFMLMIAPSQIKSISKHQTAARHQGLSFILQLSFLHKKKSGLTPRVPFCFYTVYFREKTIPYCALPYKMTVLAILIGN